MCQAVVQAMSLEPVLPSPSSRGQDRFSLGALCVACGGVKRSPDCTQGRISLSPRTGDLPSVVAQTTEISYPSPSRKTWVSLQRGSTIPRVHLADLGAERGVRAHGMTRG